MNRHFLIAVCMIAFACASVSTAPADTIRVPADQPTIQAGIDAAKPGDLVLIADGVYTGPDNKNLDFAGKAITVRGENGRDACIIDCEQDGRAFYFHSGEGADSVLEGLTIRNGRADHRDPVSDSGAGILCVGSSPTIKGCTLAQCRADGGGGGVYLGQGSDAIIRGCTFSGNRAISGGGVATEASNPIIIGCEFTGNRACGECGEGGGLASFGGSPRILDCSFTGNTGGGLGVGSGTPLIRNCIFVSNQRPWSAAISCFRASPTIERCRFVGNTASEGTGTIGCSATTVIVDCEFQTNRAGLYGGGALSIVPGTIVRNCTFVGNRGGDDTGGGAIFSRSGGPTIASCIFWANTPDQLAFIDAPLLVSYSIVQGGWPGEGNIDLDPLFVDLANGDLHLLPESPAIDAGDPGLIPSPAETDIDAQKRIWNARVDMGSDEFGSFAFGDLNCDERFDAFDIEPFLVALFDPDEYQERYPDCDINLGDINGDGSVNVFDIEPFLELLFP